MPSWATFAAGGAELLHVQTRGDRGHWQPFEGGASALATAGERLLTQPPAGIAMLATVARTGVPRVHPFMPRVVDGALVAFLEGSSPKLQDVLAGRPCAIHSASTFPAPPADWMPIELKPAATKNPGSSGASPR